MGKGGGSICLPNLLEVVGDAIVSVSADLGIYDQVGNEPDRLDLAMDSVCSLVAAVTWI